MKKELLEEIKKAFPSYKSKSFDYVVTMNDIEKLFSLLNKCLFSSKLDRSCIDIYIKSYGEFGKNKGTFNFVRDSIERSEIRIFKNNAGDNFGQIVSVLCHEMIHAYDRYYGDMKKIIELSNSRHEIPNVVRTKHTQYVNGYDVHGKYFMSIVEKAKQYGLTVKIHYESNDRNLMKKIDEDAMKAKLSKMKTAQGNPIDTSFFKTPFLVEDEIDNVDGNSKDAVQTLYDNLENCDKDFGYVDKDHWYISIA